MNVPAKLLFHKFDTNDPLLAYADTTNQILYLHSYLCEQGTQSVIEEQNYFDRDYLAEHASFYSISSKGYPNVCRRLHFFSRKIVKSTLKNAMAGGIRSINNLQASYLGFIVLRPIPSAPLGRTVLAWFPENNQNLPRVTNPSREYTIHLAGIELSVEGLAWQQQDSAVGACATVGLWTMLHSSSFDDLHSIPTTVEITQAANRNATYGRPIFPSKGLTHYQLFDAIREQNLMPMVIEGDVKVKGTPCGFKRSRFVSNCASFIRSGYPILLWVNTNIGAHIVVVGGFRSSTPSNSIPDSVGSDDIEMAHLYIHDDNIGPHVRMRIVEYSKEGKTFINLVADPPVLTKENLFMQHTSPYDFMIPTRMYVAAHSEVRLSPDHFNKTGLQYTNWILAQLRSVGWGGDLLFSTRYIKICDYLGRGLQRSSELTHLCSKK